MRLQDPRLGLENINRKKDDPACECVGVSFQKESRDSDVIKGLKFECVGVRGSNFDIKVENTPANKAVFDEVQKKLRTLEVVKIKADNLQIRPYALLGKEGNLYSGISVKADSIRLSDERSSGNEKTPIDEVEIDFGEVNS